MQQPIQKEELLSEVNSEEAIINKMQLLLVSSLEAQRLSLLMNGIDNVTLEKAFVKERRSSTMNWGYVYKFRYYFRIWLVGSKKKEFYGADFFTSNLRNQKNKLEKRLYRADSANIKEDRDGFKLVFMTPPPVYPHVYYVSKALFDSGYIEQVSMRGYDKVLMELHNDIF